MEAVFTTANIVNYTNVHIPKPMAQLLSLGPKFALSPKEFDEKLLFQVVADVEAISQSTTDQMRNEKVHTECLRFHLSNDIFCMPPP